MVYKRFLVLSIIVLFFSLGIKALNTDELKINSMSLETRKAIRKEILGQLIRKYENNQTFTKVYDYMVEEYKVLHKSSTPRSPEIVIQETFDKARLMFDRTKPFIGNNFTREYNPAEIEKKVKKFIWLKGVCFLVLGINDEHRMALAYFYLSGNQELKNEFLKDVVIYSFPEIPDVAENKFWQSEMMAVMERLGYKIFSIKKFIKKDATLDENEEENEEENEDEKEDENVETDIPEN